jgi:hypothetical protein
VLRGNCIVTIVFEANCEFDPKKFELNVLTITFSLQSVVYNRLLLGISPGKINEIKKEKCLKEKIWIEPPLFSISHSLYGPNSLFFSPRPNSLVLNPNPKGDDDSRRARRRMR